MESCYIHKKTREKKQIALKIALKIVIWHTDDVRIHEFRNVRAS